MKAKITLCIYFLTLLSVCGQAPQISYATPNIFTLNEAINPLMASNTGGIIPTEPVVSTLAGTGTSGAEDGLGSAARFNLPTVVTIDLQNNIIVVDRSNHKIRRITSDGTVSTIAGTGAIGSNDGPGNTATFKYPDGAVVDSQGNIFISDQSNHKIRKITPSGTVSTFAGSGVAGFLDGIGTSAKFYYPAGMAIDGNDNLYVADYSNNRIRKITPVGLVTTYAGIAAAGNVDGNSSVARFNGPTGVCLDPLGNVYVADYGNHKVRKIDIMGQVSTIAGTGISGATDALGTSASFNHPAIVAFDGIENLYITDEGNNKIRKISADGQVTTFAGTGIAGANDGDVNVATFNGPTGVAVASDKLVYIADYSNHKIRKICTYGYSVVPALPSGLTLDPFTGEIAGTPAQVSSPTDYTVTATNQYGSSSFVVSIEIGVLGVGDFDFKDFKVYPNPVKDIVRISGIADINSVSVYTDLGQEIKRFEGGIATKSIDFSDLPIGVYLLKITTTDGLKEITIMKE